MRRPLAFVAVVAMYSAIQICTPPASAEATRWTLTTEEPDVDAAPNDPSVVVGGEVSAPGSTQGTSVADHGDTPFAVAYVLACSENAPGSEQAQCAGARTCPDPTELLYILWVKQTKSSPWLPTTRACLGRSEVTQRPRVTPDLVLREVRRIGLPALRVHVQPEDETLVHLDTIFFAEPQPFERTVQLLGFTVGVQATPSSYAWSFGDGAGTTTDTPGGPYPDKSVTHAYKDAHVTEQASVDVTYTVRFQVDGGAWQSLDETVTADGPATAVTVKEAVPVLSGG